MPIKIAIVDDNKSITDSLLLNLTFFEEIEVVFTAINGEDLLEKLIKNEKPQLILMDIEMPQMDGIKTTFEVNKLYGADIKVIMLTAFEQDEKVFDAIKAGATGYLLKDESPAVIVKAIHEAMEGGSPMSPSIATKILQMLRSNFAPKIEPIIETKSQTDFNLTKREIEILDHISKGAAYKQIADLLFVSDKTIKKHIENIYAKLQINSKYEAMTLAMKYKW
jgi:DNA-binding NarL/FixJ family response regulator